MTPPANEALAELHGAAQIMCVAFPIKRADIDKAYATLARLLAAADALAEAHVEVMAWIDNWSPSFIEDSDWEDTEAAAKAALTDYQEARDGK